MNIKYVKILDMNAYVEHNVHIIFVMHCVDGCVSQHNKAHISNMRHL